MVCIEYKGGVLEFSNTSLAINFLEKEGLSHPQISNFRFVPFEFTVAMTNTDINNKQHGGNNGSVSNSGISSDRGVSPHSSQ
jgi:hypothetical protein